MAKKRYIKQFSNFEDESIECEILSTDNGSELCMTIDMPGSGRMPTTAPFPPVPPVAPPVPDSIDDLPF